MASINWGEALGSGLIAFVGVGAFLISLMMLSRLIIAKGAQPYAHLLKTGTTVQAEIMQIQETNVTVKNQRVVRLQLEVTTPNGQYETALKLPVPIDKIIQLQPGTILPAKIDSTHPHKIAIDISNL